MCLRIQRWLWRIVEAVSIAPLAVALHLSSVCFLFWSAALFRAVLAISCWCCSGLHNANVALVDKMLILLWLTWRWCCSGWHIPDIAFVKKFMMLLFLLRLMSYCCCSCRHDIDVLFTVLQICCLAFFSCCSATSCWSAVCWVGAAGGLRKQLDLSGVPLPCCWQPGCWVVWWVFAGCCWLIDWLLVEISETSVAQRVLSSVYFSCLLGVHCQS